MKRFVNALLSVSLAALSAISLSSCKNNNDISSGNLETASTVSTSAVSLSEKETEPQTSETEITETESTTAAEPSETEQTEKKRETPVSAELDGDYFQWAQTAADTVYRFLNEKICYPNTPMGGRFGFIDLTFDGIPELIIAQSGMWGGPMTAYTINGDMLYSYSTVYDEYEFYIASVDGETGEKVMLFEAKGGHGFVISKEVYALTGNVLYFYEEQIYNQDGEIYVHDAKVYSGDDLIEESEDCGELYRKYFGKYEELYRFSSETYTIEVPDGENYTLDDVYACVSQVMKKYSETAVTETAAEESSVEKDGSYTTPEDVAEYIHTFGTLPSNFITKSEAKELGWDNKKGNLWDVAEGKSIGGDRFGNYEGLLPEKKGRKYTECDVNYEGGYRGSERIIFSNDGLIYYTDDHYQTFTQLY